MARYMYYKKDTGEIVSQHTGHPHDKDPLTAERQEAMLNLMFGDSPDYHNMGMLVDEGDGAVFIPDVVENCEVGSKTKTKVKQAHLNKIK